MHCLIVWVLEWLISSLPPYLRCHASSHFDISEHKAQELLLSSCTHPIGLRSNSLFFPSTLAHQSCYQAGRVRKNSCFLLLISLTDDVMSVEFNAAFCHIILARNKSSLLIGLGRIRLRTGPLELLISPASLPRVIMLLFVPIPIGEADWLMQRLNRLQHHQGRLMR